MSFRGKNAVVTGGAGGIGLQVSKQLLAAGAAVGFHKDLPVAFPNPVCFPEGGHHRFAG